MIAKNSAIIMVGSIACALAAILGQLMIARTLGPAVFGMIALAIATIYTANSVTDCGLTSAHLKIMNDELDINSCYSSFAILRLLIILPFPIISLVLFEILGSGLGIAFTISIILYYILYDISIIFKATFDAKGEFSKGQKVLMADSIPRNSAIVLVLILFPSIGGVALSYLSGGLVSLLFGFLLIRKEKIHWSRPTRIPRYVKIAAPIAIPVVLFGFAQNLDIVMLGQVVPAADLGFFSASKSMILMLYFIPNAVATVLTISLAKNVALGASIDSNIVESAKICIVTTIPAIGVLLIAPSLCLELLYGRQMIGPPIVLQIMILSFILFVFCQILNSIALSKGDSRIIGLAGIAGIIMTMVMLVFMVGQVGSWPSSTDYMMVAALSTAFGNIVTLFILLFAYSSTFKLFLKPYGKALALCILIVGVLAAVESIFAIDQPNMEILLIACYLIIFSIAARVLKIANIPGVLIALLRSSLSKLVSQKG